MAISISDFKVFVDGVLDADASADKFREYLVVVYAFWNGFASDFDGCIRFFGRG